LLRMLGDREMTDEFVQEMFDKIDTDGSLKIEFGEFVAFVNLVNSSQAESEGNTFTKKIRDVTDNIGNTTSTILLLDGDVQAALGLGDRVKAGTVAHILETRYSLHEPAINAAIRVVYLNDIAIEDLESFFDGLMPNRHNVISPTHMHHIMETFFDNGLTQPYQTPELQAQILERVDQVHVFGFDDLKEMALALHPAENVTAKSQSKVSLLIRRVSSIQIEDGEELLAGTRMCIRRKDRPRVSRMIASMKHASYNDHHINVAVRALFLGYYNDVRELFNMFDVTGDGSIDKNEFLKALKIFGLDVGSGDLIERLISAVDEDGSGELEFNEYCAVIQGLQSDYALAVFKIEKIQAENWEATRQEREVAYQTNGYDIPISDTPSDTLSVKSVLN